MSDIYIHNATEEKIYKYIRDHYKSIKCPCVAVDKCTKKPTQKLYKYATDCHKKLKDDVVYVMESKAYLKSKK